MAEPPSGDLSGLRVGLSGAVPEQAEWGGRALDWEILNTVSTLADALFGDGGHLVHGSHPSFTPRILAQAEPYASELGKPVVTFVLSGLFADGHLAHQLRQKRYREVLRLIVVEPVVPAGLEGQGADDARVRNPSLEAMRERLVGEMDALVIVGGKHWRRSEKRPGTLQELDFAIRRRIPCFLLGGFGGMAAELAIRPEYRERLANGLSDRDNDFLLTTSNYGLAVATIAERLGALALEKIGSRPLER